MKSSLSDKRVTIISVSVLLAVWELLSLIAGSDRLLPGPLETLKAAFGILCDLSFLKVAGATVLRAIAGFAAAIISGGILGIAGGLNSTVHSFVKPWIILVRSIPVIALVLLAILWFSSDVVPVFIGILIMLPIVYLNIVEGIRSIDPKIVQMARFYGIGGRRLIREIYLPGIRPFAVSGMSNAVGMGWRAIVVGEVLSQPQWGIGTAMHSAQIFLQVDILMAWTLVAVLFGAIFDKILNYGYHS